MFFCAQKRKRVIKITVEEIEILVTTRIEDNLKQNIPKIKQMVEKIKQQFEKVNKKMRQLKGNNIDKTLQTQFQKAGTSVEKYEKQLEQTKEKLKNVYAQMDERVENTWSSVMPDGLDRNNPKVASAVEPVVNSTLEKDSVYNRLITQEGQLNAKVEELSLKLQEARQNYASIDAQIQQAQSKQNAFTRMIDKLKSGVKNVKSQTDSVKNAFNKLPNISAKVNAKIKQMSKNTKTGLRHVLKYAGALFSLRGIYSVLSNSASAWLSSQNSQAKQLSANIEYMKYAMRKRFCPCNTICN